MISDPHKTPYARWRYQVCLVAVLASGCGEVACQDPGGSVSTPQASSQPRADAESEIQTIGFITVSDPKSLGGADEPWGFADDPAALTLQPLPPLETEVDEAPLDDPNVDIFSTPVVSLLPPQPIDDEQVESGLSIAIEPPMPGAPEAQVKEFTITEADIQTVSPQALFHSPPLLPEIEQPKQEDLAVQDSPAAAGAPPSDVLPLFTFDGPLPWHDAEPTTAGTAATQPSSVPTESDAAVGATEKASQADASTLHPVATGVPTGVKVNERAKVKIRRGYLMAQRGAYYSARREFTEVLQLLAQAKDNLSGKPRRGTALSAGLRALREAADFAPRGVILDASVDLAVITSSHSTPVAKDPTVSLPQQLMDRYLRYAQKQLGAAVAGEPAGSMALHALGKLYSQLGRVEPEQHPLATRIAYSYQQASLFAHNGNHLAAHELGVLMAESGHYAQAENLLTQVASREPHPEVLKNLAKVQGALGRVEAAAATEAQADAMRAHYASTNGVQWVPPSAFSQGGSASFHQPQPHAPLRMAQRPR